MILQLVMTISLGVGVLSLATVALLNTAGLRLHDVHNLAASGTPDFVFVYASDSAEKLRRSFARTPFGIGIALIVAIVGIGVFVYFAESMLVSQQDAMAELYFVEASIGTQPEPLQLSEIMVWLVVSSFIAVLVLATCRISHRLYKVLQSP